MPEVLFCKKVLKDKFEVEKGVLTHVSLFYITKGEISYTIGGKSEKAQAGDFVCFPTGVYMEREIVRPIEFYHVVFEYSEDFTLPGGKIRLADRSRLLSTLEYLCSLDLLPVENQSLKSHFLRDIFMQLKACDVNKSMQKDEVVIKATEFFRENISRKITLEETARKTGVSVPGLILHFKSGTGVSPIRYLVSMRIKTAENLLCNTDLPIAQISEKCGFENPYYFSNTFKKHNSMTPSEFRRRFRI